MDFIIDILRKLHVKNFVLLTVSGIVNAFGILRNKPLSGYAHEGHCSQS